MHIFHIVEFTVFVAVLAYFFNPFLFVLIGMLFHSVLDIIDMIYNKKWGVREFSLIKYLVLNKKNKNKYL